MKTPEDTLEWLLAYNGTLHILPSGHYLKFDIKRVDSTDRVPHGISYSFTFHDSEGARLLGFDNAHPVPHLGGRFVKPKVEADHWHRASEDEGRPYYFVSAEQLLLDFYDAFEKLCETLGVSPDVVDIKETRP